MEPVVSKSKKSYVAMKISKLGSLANLTETKNAGMYADMTGMSMARAGRASTMG